MHDFTVQHLPNISSFELLKFKDTFFWDGIIIKESRGIKSKAAKISAKQMLRKLYKIGRRSFDKAIKSSTKKITSCNCC